MLHVFMESDNCCMLIILQVYNLFRQLGLRHILVVPRASRVIGLITRKDLLIEVFTYCPFIVFKFTQLHGDDAF